MIEGKSVLAIVPARGGSKGLPGKNVRPLLGKPLLAWSVEAGLDSRYVDTVVVSTESEEIAAAGLAAGALVPFLRPADLATDTTSSFEVIAHALGHCKDGAGRDYDYAVLLEPTSPMRDAQDVDRALEQLLAHGHAQSIVGVSRTESQNPAFLVTLTEKGFMVGYEDRDMSVLRRQDISDVYFFEGSVYISEVPALLSKKTFYHERTIPYEVPKWKSLEIDDMDDFVMTEAIMKYRGYGV